MCVTWCRIDFVGKDPKKKRTWLREVVQHQSAELNRSSNTQQQPEAASATAGSYSMHAGNAAEAPLEASTYF